MMTTKRRRDPASEEEPSSRSWVRIPLPELAWEIEAQGAVVAGALQIVGMQMRPRRDCTQFVDADFVISAEALRALPVRRIKEHLAAVVTAEIGIRVDDPAPDGRWTEEHFRMVASAYETAVEAGIAPLPLIQEYWGDVSRTAASRWVRIARERGYLGYPEKRGVAGATARSTPDKRSGASSEARTEEPKAMPRKAAASRVKGNRAVRGGR